MAKIGSRQGDTVIYFLNASNLNASPVPEFLTALSTLPQASLVIAFAPLGHRLADT